MNIPKELRDNFYSGKRSDDIRYIINDGVRIQTGPNKGKLGAVISIESIEPEVSYLVELGDGTGDVTVPQSSLELIDPSEYGAT